MSISIGLNQAKELLEKGVSEAQEIIRTPGRVDELLVQLEAHLKDVPVIGETLSDIPLMVSMLKAYVSGTYTKVSPKVIACLAGAILYMIKKEDLIPDNLSVIGAADDIGVLGLALKICGPELQEYAQWRDGSRAAVDVPDAEQPEDPACAEEDAQQAEESAYAEDAKQAEELAYAEDAKQAEDPAYAEDCEDGADAGGSAEDAADIAQDDPQE